ncbi:hypothetical protein ABR737_11565 [Streptomyces sp. Edi2]|uniref:hypothetical protein n=1 Tax=Streptomyces sp. Edi2 TaxID=3162528 RepID=UPI0033066A99
MVTSSWSRAGARAISRGHWRKGKQNFSGDARVNVKARYTGELQFRSVLYSTDKHHQHARTDRTSASVTIRVAR